jgi:multidrug efflux pump subunit AcrA (membrane-fusion protein)
VIEDELADPLRPGMTAEVEVDVGYYPDIIALPVQAVTAHGKHHYAFAQDGEAFVPRRVTVGQSNYQMIEIKSGIEEGTVVALDARNRAIATFGEQIEDEPDRAEPDGAVQENEGELASR